MFGHTKQFKQLTEEKKEEKPPIKPLLEDLQFISDCYRAFFKVGVNDSWKVVFREFFKQVKFHFGDRRFLVVTRSDFVDMADRQGILVFSREEDKTGRMGTFKSRTLFNCSLGFVYDFIKTVPSVTLKDGIEAGNLVFQVHQGVIEKGGRKLVTTIQHESPEEITARAIFNALWGIFTEPKRNVIGTPIELAATSVASGFRPDCDYVKSNERPAGVSKYVVPEDNILVGKGKDNEKEIKFTPTPFGYIIWLSPDVDGGIVEKVGWLYSRV